MGKLLYTYIHKHKVRTTYAQYFHFGRPGGGAYKNIFHKIISLQNLFRAWDEFKRGKIKKQDVAGFAVNLEEEIFQLHKNLLAEIYKHGSYHSFYINDPKRRNINKPTVLDRILHHAIHRILESIFEKSFIFDSYSSREGKGMHRAHERFNKFAWKLSRNDTKPVWILKCDIKKYFDSIDHSILLRLLREKIDDIELIQLLSEIIESFQKQEGKGIPLGNLTSQLFSNVYLNPLDHYIKRELKVKYYIRYADDFVLMESNKNKLETCLKNIRSFIEEKLLLSLHPDKITFHRFSEGVDFLGYIIFPHHKILRIKTKRRMMKKIKILKSSLNSKIITEERFKQSFSSYLGLLKHGSTRKLQKKINLI